MCNEFNEFIPLSQSFRLGVGGIKHNLRMGPGRSVRANGLAERRHLNEYIIKDESIGTRNYVDDLIRKSIERKIGPQLAKLNEKYIKQRQPSRCKTVDSWLETQRYTRNGKQREVVCEVIVQLGDKLSGCPYEVELDKDGNMLDTTGRVIKPYDTRKRPAYRNGVITESEMCKRIKEVYRDFVKRFQKKNPQLEVICAAVHCDEYGGCHMHLNFLPWSVTKNGVGYGLGKTTALQQQYAAMGVSCGNTRTGNAEKKWCKDMRMLLKQVAIVHGFEKLSKGNKEQHKDTPEFKKFKDNYVDQLEAEIAEKERLLQEKEALLKEKESLLSSDIAKQEWYVLKKFHPEWYSTIHTDFLAYRSKLKNNTKILEKNL